MTDYPTAAKAFTVDNRRFEMYRLTLAIQHRLEDPDTEVKYIDVLSECTDMSIDDIDALHTDQLMAIYSDILSFSYDFEDDGDGEPKKP